MILNEVKKETLGISAFYLYEITLICVSLRIQNLKS